MMQIALSLWTPSSTGYPGRYAWYAWFLYLDLDISVPKGIFMIRMRFCGIGAEFTCISPKTIKNNEKKEGFGAENGENIAVPASEEAEEYRKFVEKMLQLGAQTIVTRMEMFNAEDKSFILPTETIGDRLPPGAKIAFGGIDDFLLVEVSGSRANEDGTTIFYGREIRV